MTDNALFPVVAMFFLLVACGPKYLDLTSPGTPDKDVVIVSQRDVVLIKMIDGRLVREQRGIGGHRIRLDPGKHAFCVAGTNHYGKLELSFTAMAGEKYILVDTDESVDIMPQIRNSRGEHVAQVNSYCSYQSTRPLTREDVQRVLDTKRVAIERCGIESSVEGVVKIHIDVGAAGWLRSAKPTRGGKNFADCVNTALDYSRFDSSPRGFQGTFSFKLPGKSWLD